MLNLTMCEDTAKILSDVAGHLVLGRDGRWAGNGIFPGWSDDVCVEFFTIGSDPNLFDESPPGYFMCVVSEYKGKVEIMDGGGDKRRFPVEKLNAEYLASRIARFYGLKKMG